MRDYHPNTTNKLRVQSGHIRLFWGRSQFTPINLEGGRDRTFPISCPVSPSHGGSCWSCDCSDRWDSCTGHHRRPLSVGCADDDDGAERSSRQTPNSASYPLSVSSCLTTYGTSHPDSSSSSLTTDVAVLSNDANMCSTAVATWVPVFASVLRPNCFCLLCGIRIHSVSISRIRALASCEHKSGQWRNNVAQCRWFIQPWLFIQAKVSQDNSCSVSRVRVVSDCEHDRSLDSNCIAWCRHEWWSWDCEVYPVFIIRLTAPPNCGNER